jgi:Na+/melibiose symporter-like transporter
MMKFSMLILPLIFIVAGYLIYLFKLKIDREMFDQILADLTARGDLRLKGRETLVDN